MSDLIGGTLGKFEITAALGGGGMAEVFKAYQPSLNRYVAIKVIHRFLANNEEFLGRFQREAQHVAALRHPNIVQVYDFDVDNGRPYMVMEYIAGPTLDKRTAERQADQQPWSLAEVIQIMSDIGGALAYAHEQDMIHRDIKPGNVMCHPNGRYILTDFGLAKLRTGPHVTATGTIMGTPAYMSPEQCQGSAGDQRADIYSLGILLYELATGKLPFEADTQVGYILKHVSEPPPLPDTINPNLPAWMTAVILRTLAKAPEDRYQNMDDFLADLQPRETTHLPMPTMLPKAPEPATLIRDKAESVTKLFAGRLKKESSPKEGKETPLGESVKNKAESVTRFFAAKRAKEEKTEETAPTAKAKQDSKTSFLRALTDKEELTALQDEIKSGLEEARASLGARQDDLASRGLETADRLRGKIQSTLETAAAKTAAVQHKRYTILAVGIAADEPLAEPQQQRAIQLLHSLIKAHEGELAHIADDSFVALFETPSDDKEPTLRAIAAGRILLSEADNLQSDRLPFALRVGIHTGILATQELDGEGLDIAKAVERATPFGQLYLSHATYRLVLWQVKTEKRETIEITADQMLQLYAVI